MTCLVKAANMPMSCDVPNSDCVTIVAKYKYSSAANLTCRIAAQQAD
jgi:hypothetical protein